MAINNVIDVVDRSMRDPVFGQKFKDDPEAVLAELEHDFDEAEKEALVSRDMDTLREELKEKKAWYGISIAGIVI